MTKKSDWRPPPGSGTFKAKMRQVACRQCGAHLEERYNFCPICGQATPRQEQMNALLKNYLEGKDPENGPPPDDSS
jgi:hypothetical protein